MTDDLCLASLMQGAIRSSGSDDLGDSGFLTAAQLLVDSCRRTARLNAVGRSVLGKVLRRHLANRLSLDAHRRRHPHLGDDAPRVAVVVTGLPRTGTTLLHNLLTLDPAFRTLRLWEALCPVPPVEPGEPHEPHERHERHERPTSARVAAAERWLDGLYSLAPSFRAVHALTATGPEECDTLLQNTFASHHFDDMFDAEDYSSWLASASLGDEYRDEAFQLRALEVASPAAAPWALKSPGHLGHLGAVLTTFHDALVVHCHREPLTAVASYARLLHVIRSPYCDAVSAREVGRQALARAGAAMDHALDARASAGDERFFDVAYPALVQDPVSVVREIHALTGRPIVPEAEEAMSVWIDENPADRYGRVPYALNDYGLTRDDVQTTFSDYLDRFGDRCSSV